MGAEKVSTIGAKTATLVAPPAGETIVNAVALVVGLKGLESLQAAENTTMPQQLSAKANVRVVMVDTST